MTTPPTAPQLGERDPATPLPARPGTAAQRPQPLATRRAQPGDLATHVPRLDDPEARDTASASQRPRRPSIRPSERRGAAARLPEPPRPSHPRLSGPRPGDLAPALGEAGRLALWERLGLEELEGLEGGEGDLGSDEPEVVEDLVLLADEALAGDVGVAVVVGNADEGAAGHLG